MRRIIPLVLLLLFSAGRAADDETSLFDSTGKPVAYIASDLTVYLWSGEPVAYLYQESEKVNVYGFNGEHLGWFKGGIVRDHDGYAVGAVREAVVGAVEFEPFKPFKQFKPFKSFREFAPSQPPFTQTWSDLPLRSFLLQGAQ